MSKIHAQFSFAALEAFQESHPDTNTLNAILTFKEEDFIENGAFRDYFNGDIRKARQVYREAQRAQEQIVLLWANLKDTVASPSVAQGLYNNIDIPQSFIQHQRNTPSYNQFFGNLDYREYDACRSIFGPAAYFVDLMRFIEKHIPQTGEQSPPLAHRLAQRQPGLFTQPLDCDNTYELIPYIDVINEVLEGVVGDRTASPTAKLDSAAFPMTLPVNLPLEEIRLYLAQLKLDLQTLYKLFGAPEPSITRELLLLSPRDYKRLELPLSRKAKRDKFYGIDTEQKGRTGLENVEVFTHQTGLSRNELNALLYGNLSPAEIAAGLSRLQFINNTGDGAGQLQIEENIQFQLFTFKASAALAEALDRREVASDLIKVLKRKKIAHSDPKELYILVDAPGAVWRLWDPLESVYYTINRESANRFSFLDEPFDRLIGLTPRKLDRIYRFLKLARSLHWSFVDLDWAIRSFQDTDSSETVLQFDGVNDFVEIKDAVGLVPKGQSALTLEAWVMPSQGRVHPIIAKGDPSAQRTDFAWWITPTGKLAFFNWTGASLISTSASALAFERPYWQEALTEAGNYPFHQEQVEGQVQLSEVIADGTGGLNLISKGALPLGSFSHVAVVVNRLVPIPTSSTAPGSTRSRKGYQLAFYINGQLDSTWTLNRPIAVGSQATTIYIGRDFNRSFLTGQLADIRLWHSLRTEIEIAAQRFQRLSGREPGLAAYWPLAASLDMQAHDFAIAHSTEQGGSLTDPRDRNPGKLGGNSHHSIPVWTQGTLALDPLLRPVSTEYRYRFNGRDTYVGQPLGKQENSLALSTLTLEAWVEISAAGRHPLITFGQVGDRLHYALWVNQNRNLVFSSDALSEDVVSTEALVLGQLTHVAVTVSAKGEIWLYIDGNQVGNGSGRLVFGEAGEAERDTQEDIQEDTPYSLYLGRDFARSPLGGNLLHGTLQEVRIWNQLQQPNLSRFYQLTGSEAGLVGYWRLDEASSPGDARTDSRLVARDRTFSGQDLMLGGDPTAYQPTLVTHNEIILPEPVASDAAVLTFTPESYPLALFNQRQDGLGHGEQFSLQLWFRPHDISHQAPQLLFAQGESEIGVVLYLAEGMLHAYAWCADFDGTAATATLERVHLSGGDDFLQDDTWHHLTLTYDETHPDGIEFRLYCDGEALGASTEGFRLDPMGSACMGGVTPDCTVRIHDSSVASGDGGAVSEGLGFAGQLSDLRLWRRAIPDVDLLSSSSRANLRHIPPYPAADLLCYAPLTEDYGRSVSQHDGPRYEEIEPNGPELPDQSPNRNHARLYVGPDRANKWENAQDLPVFPDRVLSLQGEQILRLPDAEALGLVDSGFTIELWLNIVAPSEEPASLLQLPGLALNLTSEGWVLERKSGAVAIAASFPSPGWHHLAWRYQNGRHDLFADGLMVGTTQDEDIPETQLQPGAVVLGTADATLEWKISELRIWQAGRSDAEIAQDWQFQLSPERPGLTALWTFLQEPSQTFVDRTGQGLEAVLETPPTVAQWFQPTQIPPTFVRQSQALVFNTPNEPNAAAYPGVTPGLVDLEFYRITPAGTIELWVEFASLDGVLFDASGDQPFVLAVRAGMLVFEVGSAAEEPTPVSLPIGTQERQHVAIAWDFGPEQAHLKLVLGDREITAIAPGGNWSGYTTPRLGLNHTKDWNALQPFRGKIAQIRIWDQIQSFEALQRLAEADLEGSETGLLHCLPLDEAEGDRLQDLVTGDRLQFQAISLPHPEPRWVAGDWAIQFNGGESGRHIEVTDYSPGSSGSIELWVKFAPQPNRDRLVNGVLFDASTDQADDRSKDKEFRLAIVEDKNGQKEQKLTLAVEDGNDQGVFISLPLNARILGDFSTFISRWHRVVASWQLRNNQLTVTIVLDQFNPVSKRENQASLAFPEYQTLYIGHRRGAVYLNDVETFNGQIRQVRIWDQPSTNSEAALLHHLLLNEGSGTALGAAAQLVAGTDREEPWLAIEQAIAFDGFSRADFTPETFIDSTTFVPKNAGSLELWARFGPVEAEQILLDASTEEVPFCLKLNPDGLVFQVGSDGAVTRVLSSETSTLSSETPALAEPTEPTESTGSTGFTEPAELSGSAEPRWHYIVARWNWEAETEQLWLTLQLDDSNALVSETRQNVPVAPQNPYLGLARLPQPRLADYRAFGGDIGQLRIWNEVKRTEDLQRFHQADLTGREPGLVCYLPIEAGQGSQLRDLTGNGDATLKLGTFAGATWEQTSPTLFRFDGAAAATVSSEVFEAIAAQTRLNADRGTAFELWVYLEETAGIQPLLNTPIPKLATEAAFSLAVVDGAVQVNLAAQRLIAAALPLSANVWHQIICQYNSEEQQIQLVIDGQRSSESLVLAADAAPFALDQCLQIGQQRRWNREHQTWSEVFLQGSIAELRIWSGSARVTLDAALSSRRLRGDEAGIVASWLFTAGSQATVVASGTQPLRGYAIAPAAPVTQLSLLTRSVHGLPQQPPLYRRRSAPVLDGYNDYLALGDTALNLDAPHTLEFWHRPETELRELSNQAPHQPQNGTSSWQHVAAVYGPQGAIEALYLNGVQVEEQALPTELLCLNGVWANHRPDDHPDQVGVGQIAELRLWAEQRSVEQILADQHRQLRSWAATLGGNWPLDEGRGDRLSTAAELLSPARLIVGLENAAEKWQQTALPIPNAVTALFFDGVDDRVILSDLAALGLDQSFTLEAWVQLSAEASQSIQPLLGSDGPTDSAALFIGFVDGYPVLQYGTAAKAEIHQKSQKALLTQAWHHVVWTVERSNAVTVSVRLWINHESQPLENRLSLTSIAQPATPADLPEQTAPSLETVEPISRAVALAAHRWSDETHAQQFNGALSQVRLWKGIRTEAELKQYWIRPLPGRSEVFETLTADWIFDDRNETILLAPLPSPLSSSNRPPEDTAGSSSNRASDNCYYLRWQSDMDREQPVWTKIDDYPMLTRALPQQALAFDGYQQYAATNSDLPPGDWTLEAWVQVDGLEHRHPIVWWGKQGKVSETVLELRVSTVGRLELAIANREAMVSTAAFPSGQRTHVAATLAETTITLFINGKSQGSHLLSAAERAALQQTGLRLQVGRGEVRGAESAAQFKGIIQELRLWDSAKLSTAETGSTETGSAETGSAEADSTETLQLSTHFYTPVVTGGAADEPVAVWPLSTINSSNLQQQVTPNQITTGPALRLGGLDNNRTPSLGEPARRIDPRRKVLTLSAESKRSSEQFLRLPHFAAPQHPNRTRRLIEVWFRSESPTAARSQTLYAEQDQDWTLRIALEGGELNFEISRNDVAESSRLAIAPTGKSPLELPTWSGSSITTQRIQPRHWHHAVVVLDSRPELRDDAFCAVLDGQVIGVKPGWQLPEHPTKISVGGVEFLPVVGDAAEHFETAVNIANPLYGQIAEVRIWEADANGALPEITTAVASEAAAAINTENEPHSTTGHLLWRWQTSETRSLARLGLQAPMRVPDLSETGSSHDQLPLADLAQLRALQAQCESPIPALCALWFELRDVGAAENPTLFDRIFNPPGPAEPWSYTDQHRWEINSDKTEDRQIQTRLMGALQVPTQSDLQAMVRAISNKDISIITLDGHFLTHLYRIRQLALLLKLSIADTLALIAVLQTPEQELETPIHSITELTVRDVQQLQERADWLRRTNIDMSEYRYLVYNDLGSRIAIPYSKERLVDGTVDLLNGARSFFVTPTSFVSEEISEAVSRAIYRYLKQKKQIIQEFELDIPAVDGSHNSNARSDKTVSIVQHFDLESVFTSDDLRVPEILKELGWTAQDNQSEAAISSLEEVPVLFKQPRLTVSEQALRDELKLLDADGFVLSTSVSSASEQDRSKPYSVNQLRKALLELDRFQGASASDFDLEKLIFLRDWLVQRSRAQADIPRLVREKLKALRQGLVETLENSFVELLESNRERIRQLIQFTTGKTFSSGKVEAKRILQDAAAIARTQQISLEAGWVQDLAQMHKVLFLLSKYELTPAEQIALLSEFGLFGFESAEHLIRPQYKHLNALYQFIRIKAEFNDTQNQVLGALQDDRQLGALTGWQPAEIERLRQSLKIEANIKTNTLEVLSQLTPLFGLIQILGADAQYLIELAQVGQLDEQLSDPLDIDSYQKQAAALLGLLRSQYNEEQWSKVFELLHGKLAPRRRDSLLAYILEDLSEVLGDRKDPNILYEYLLLDVQTGSEVKTSRIVQATASLQLYIQRCLMNLEKDVQPEQIPTQEWEWMKNYRVWEANRKVFLYPENYIEPELRDTKTPLFQALMDELQQNDVNQGTVEAAYKHYFNQFAEISNLTIVGSYVDTERQLVDASQASAQRSSDENSKILYLVGRNDNTQEYYIRRWVHEVRWEPWQKINLAINATSVSPVFAFNRLFLFWIELTESVRAENRRWVENSQENGRPLDQNGKEIRLRTRKINEKGGNNIENTWSQSVDGETIYVSQAEIDRIDGGKIKQVGDKYIVYNPSLNNLSEQINVPFHNVSVKYSYANFSGEWIQPQELSIEEISNLELNDSQKLEPKWQRIYAQRWRNSNIADPIQDSPARIQNLTVAQLGPGSSIALSTSLESSANLTFSCWLRLNDLVQKPETSTIPPIFLLFRYAADSNEQTENSQNNNQSSSQSNASGLTAWLAQTYTPIEGKINIQRAVDESQNAVAVLESAVKQIRDGSSAENLEKARTESNRQRGSLLQAAQKVRREEPAAILAKKLVESLAILGEGDRSAISLAKNKSKDLAKRVVEILRQATEDGHHAMMIASSTDSAADALFSAESARETAKAAADKIIENSNNATVKAETDNALNAAVTALEHLKTLLDEAKAKEDQVPKYKRSKAQFQLELNGGEKKNLFSIDYGQWYHIGLNVDYNGEQYVIKPVIFCQNQAEQKRLNKIKAIEIESPNLLPTSGTLQVGRHDNPSVIEADNGQYEPLMSEMRLWCSKRSSAEIERSRYHRLHGGETCLAAHLPLSESDDQAALPTQEYSTASAPELRLYQVFPPRVSEIERRERIVLIYGDSIIKTLRNTLKDVGYNFELEVEHSREGTYRLALKNEGSGSSVGYNNNVPLLLASYQSQKACQTAGNQATGNRQERYPYDRFLPQSRDILNTDISRTDKSATLKKQIESWMAKEYDSDAQSLLRDESGSSLKIDESYILDIANQPNWYILDIGDEIFLVQLDLERNGQPLDIKTIEGRLEARLKQTDSTKTFSLRIKRDTALEAEESDRQNFHFLRLNTFAVQKLSELLFSGVDELLNLKNQVEVQEPDFGNLQIPLDGESQTGITASSYFPDRGEGLRNPIDFEGSYGLYYEEIFFHIPFLIANQLSANQQFAEAQRWYHYIFDPTAQEDSAANPRNSKDRYWRYRSFRGRDLESLAEMLSNARALEAYRTDPFDPHTLAQLRINTYQKAVVMKYIDNLVNWGDSLFRQDTLESITEATQLYVLASTLLGPQPKGKPARESDPVGSYNDIRRRIAQKQPMPAQNGAATGDRALDNRTLLPDFVVGDSRPISPAPLAIPFDPNQGVITDFGVPENAQFLGYWETVGDRLFKIRHSLNIDGVFRTQALFQPPIDPAALVNAAASGIAGGFSNALASGQVVTPHYRFGHTLEKAKEMVGYVIDFSTALTDALNSRGEEELSLLQHAQELKILEMTIALKELDLVQAQKNSEDLKLSLQGAQQRQDNFKDLIKEFISPLEGTEIAFKFASIISTIYAGGLKIASALGSSLPEIEVGASGVGGSPVATASVGPKQAGDTIARISEFAELIADLSDRSGNIIGTFAGYERRKREWEQSKTEVENEIEQIKVQIETARAQVEAANREIGIHHQSIAHHQEVGEFYRRKFFNRDLKIWLANRLSSLYFQAYKIAFDLAKQAERAYQFEFGSNDSYISFGYWDSRRKGMLAGESLRLDLMRLEKASHDQDSRYLEITKTISLARIDPLAFLQLRRTGRCQFSLSEMLFDRDYPGHYFRIIKSVSLSIPAIVGPYESVHATLTQTGHKTLLSPDLSGVKYLIGEQSEQPDSVRVDWRANQQIALSTGVEDSGLFQLDFNDDRYLPFENTGAVSNWVLELPKQTNRFDFDSMTDVVIHLRYMCAADHGSFKQGVMGLEDFKSYRGARLFSLAHEFSAEWFAFSQSAHQNHEITLSLPRNTVPPHVEINSFVAVPLYIVSPEGELKTVDSQAFEIDHSLPTHDKPATVTLKLDQVPKEMQNLLLLIRYEGAVS